MAVLTDLLFITCWLLWPIGRRWTLILSEFLISVSCFTLWSSVVVDRWRVWHEHEQRWRLTGKGVQLRAALLHDPIQYQYFPFTEELGTCSNEHGTISNNHRLFPFLSPTARSSALLMAVLGRILFRGRISSVRTWLCPLELSPQEWC